MSDPSTDRPASEPAREPRPEPQARPRTSEPGSSTENSSSDQPSGRAANGDRPPGGNRRRRGSRGGRGRGSGTGNRSQSGGGNGGNGGGGDDAAARRPDVMPDPPWEGRPSPEAAERAEVPYKPKIGDTRPAPGGRAGGPPGGGGGGGGPRPRGDGGGDDASRGDGGGKRRRRRGGRGRSRSGGGGGGGGGGERRPVEALVGDAADLDEELLARRQGRERKGRPVGRYQMAVHVHQNTTQIAVLEGRALIEHYVSRPQDDATQIDGNIYLGRVQNVLPGMEAAFIDIGTPKNAVLYRGDVRFDKEDVEGGSTSSSSGGDARIEQLLRAGQTIVCQVTKNPIGTKGARHTQEVSLPGRFCVLIPNSSTYGISKRLTDDERKRLRRVLDDVKPAEHGIIVRTAAEGATTDELRRDVIRLVKQWDAIDALAKRSRVPALLYREPDMAVRVIREEFNKDYRSVVIDDHAIYEEVRDYVGSITPELADRVEFYDTSVEPLPVYERFHVHEQLHKALDRKVWLPSGGSLIIERTEALTVVDVNTGKNVGKSNLEETVFRNNLEAAEEIARQLRLRDIGGIIVIDFIDMEIRRNRDEVIKAFREALARDKTRTQVFDISELGLVEMTRKRISEGLVESFSDTCPTCDGRGIIIDEQLL
ncbi:MAG: ribonuclease [Actinomycetota bacterium]|nr:ribonuclease [Actinomycetota bacterium]